MRLAASWGSFAPRPPHFWALALIKKDDYAAANIPMLPIVAGEKLTRKYILIYSFLLVPCSFLPWIFDYSGNLYLFIAMISGLEFLRRSWNIRPEPLNKNNPYHPINIEIYKNIPKDKIPDTESLKDTYERVIPYFKKNISNKLNKNIIIAAHGNSIRALCKHLFNIDNENISKQ